MALGVYYVQNIPGIVGPAEDAAAPIKPPGAPPPMDGGAFPPENTGAPLDCELSVGNELSPTEL